MKKSSFLQPGPQPPFALSLSKRLRRCTASLEWTLRQAQGERAWRTVPKNNPPYFHKEADMTSTLQNPLRRLLVAAALAAPLLAHAAWPDRPIRFIVPYTPGGATDVTARVLAQQIGQTLGTSVVVENRGGASGNIGMELAARAPADGYTIVMASAGQTIAASYFTKLNYSLKKDFVPVALAVRNQRMLVGRLGLPYNNVAELVAWGKRNPGQITYASFGRGSSGHLAGELFAQRAGIKFIDIPFKGNADGVNELLAGRVDVMFSELSSVIQHVQSGKLKAYAVGSEARYEGTPNVPTVSEGGLAGVEVSGWLGVMAPAGTPPDVVKKLNEAIVAALRLPAVKARFADMGAESVITTSESFSKFIDVDLEKWEKVMKAGNISDKDEAK